VPQGWSSFCTAQVTNASVQRAETLVAELRQFPAALPGIAPSDGRLSDVEARRRAVYDELWALGDAAVPALTRGLVDRDVRIRRGVALFLNVAAGPSNQPSKPRFELRPGLPALIAALADPDTRVRGLVAQAVGMIGEEAAAAVPALAGLLEGVDEGSRISACIGLTGIGPRARAGLPALRHALADPSADVRQFAQQAINAIDR
jgi:HEAT repeat protein